MWTDWSGYLKFLDAVGDSPVRVTYDRGTLELMAPSRKHEKRRSLLARLLEAWMLAAGIDFDNGGSLTLQRKDLDRGLEPDECYWIGSFARVAGNEDYDPLRDPPPDLAIEVEVSQSAVDRMGIYAALGIGEVWRLPLQGPVQVHVLTGGGYQAVDRSPTLPGLPLGALSEFLEQGRREGVSRMLQAFRGWLQRG